MEGNLKVWTVNGQLVFEKQIAKTAQVHLNIEEWSNGMYMVELNREKDNL